MATIRGYTQILAIAAVVLPFGVAPASAGVCDLTTTGSTCSPVSFGGGAIYTTAIPSGTFYIDPFLQITKAGSYPIEKGYNTGGAYQYQQTGDTTNLSLSDVPLVTIDGVQYREFLLSINEPGGSPQLSLDQLQIFLSPNANLVNYDAATGKLAGLTAVYDMDAGGTDNWVNLNYSVSALKGPVTAIVYVPNSLFTQSSDPQYVYLYSQFGGAIGGAAGGGLEEWWVKTNSSGIKVTMTPEPGSLILLGSGVAALAARYRKRRRVTAS